MLQGPASKGPPGSTAIILGGFRMLDEEDFGTLFPHFSWNLILNFLFFVFSSQELLNIPTLTLVFAMNQSFIVHNPIIKLISGNQVSNSTSFWSYKNELISFVCKLYVLNTIHDHLFSKSIGFQLPIIV